MPAASALIPVLNENRNCLGHILRRGPTGVEAFNADNTSLGLFQSEHEAVVEIWRHRHHQCREIKRI